MDRRRNKKAFTLLELMVAVGVLSMMVMFSGKIFKMCLDGHRGAAANAEILQKLRVLTEQLNSDFSGICKDGPVLIKFGRDPADPNICDDQIMFFATGDFQSIQLYNDDTGDFIPSSINPPPTNSEYTLRGNTARVYYGLAQSNDPNDGGAINPPMVMSAIDRVLARRRHILTAKLDTAGLSNDIVNLETWPDGQAADLEFGLNTTLSGKSYNKNELYEHDCMSLAQWKTIDIEYYDVAKNKADILPICFGNAAGGDRAMIDMADPLTFHKLLSEHVGSFSVQWSYWDTIDNQLKWYPSDDPDGDGANDDSHFILPGYEDGVYFNVPWGAAANSPTGWHGIDDNNSGIDGDVEYDTTRSFPDTFFPKAFKFTFRLYDSGNFIKGGRLFTHIVYVD